MDDLERELEELEQEDLDKDLLGVGPSTSELPEVPTAEPAAAAKDKKKGNHSRALIKAKWTSPKINLFSPS